MQEFFFFVVWNNAILELCTRCQQYNDDGFSDEPDFNFVLPFNVATQNIVVGGGLSLWTAF